MLSSIVPESLEEEQRTGLSAPWGLVAQALSESWVGSQALPRSSLALL